MHIEIPLLGLALYLLFWDKLPNWGTWFNWIVGHMPRCVQYLYTKWHCAYCSGFWLGLALHGITGMWFLPELQTLPHYWGPAGPFIGWFLDALAVATVIFISKTLFDMVKRIGKPA